MPDDAVTTHLQEHAGQDHRDRRGGFDVSVGQPCMERERREFDGKADEQQDERGDLHLLAEEAAVTGHVGQGDQAELAAAVEVEHQHGDEHQHTTQQRVQEELDGRVLATRSTPDADQEVHRQQHDFPEDIEEEEVERHEDAEHAGLEQQEQHQIAANGFGDAPRGHHRQHADQRGEQDERQADAVDSQAIVHVPVADPRLGDAQLDRRVGRVEPLQDQQRQAERDRGDDEREDPHRFDGPLVECHQTHGADSRQEDRQCEQDSVTHGFVKSSSGCPVWVLRNSVPSGR